MDHAGGPHKASIISWESARNGRAAGALDNRQARGKAWRSPPAPGFVVYKSELCAGFDQALRTSDFAPLWRSTIGFDRLFDLAESAQRMSEDNYPPYNIERLTEDRYAISLALAASRPTRSTSPPSTTS